MAYTKPRRSPYGSARSEGYCAPMRAPRDIKDRIFKRLLRHPRMVRDMLSGFVPAAWLADVWLESLRELPTEYITTKGHRRLGDLLWLADREGGGHMLVMAEHQTQPGQRMSARMTAQIGMLFEGLRSDMRDPDGRFPALLPLVVYAGGRRWRENEDLSTLVGILPAPLGVRGDSYLLLDLGRIASEYPPQQNRFWVLARLTFAGSVAEAKELLAETSGWLDLADEEEHRLLSDLVAWFHALTPQGEAADWDTQLQLNEAPEETMGRLATLETNTRLAMRRSREQGKADGIAQGMERGMQRGIAQGMERQLAMLARLATRQFGVDWGVRLAAALRPADDPAKLDRAADLILDCATGEELLGRLNA